MHPTEPLGRDHAAVVLEMVLIVVDHPAVAALRERKNTDTDGKGVTAPLLNRLDRLKEQEKVFK